jgi:uncharacterized metal-binding protein
MTFLCGRSVNAARNKSDLAVVLDNCRRANMLATATAVRNAIPYVVDLSNDTCATLG